MNQEKIGKFIAETRKSKNITQSELAEKLGVTDRSISNWENGKNMPDLSLFKPLCDILEITINDLMSGERVDNKKYNEKLEENIINTIDYIDKKNDKNEDKKNIALLVTGCLGMTLSLLILNEGDIKDFLTVITMMIAIYGLNGLVKKYSYIKRIITIILAVICIITLYLNLR